MILKESLNTIRQNASSLRVKVISQNNNQAEVEGLIGLRKALNTLEEIDVFKSEIKQIKEMPQVFNIASDKAILDLPTYHSLQSNLSLLNTKISTLLKFWQDLVPIREDAIDIKFPNISTFSELENVAKDLKIAIEITLSALKIDHKLEILTAEPGSIWISVALGSKLAVEFIGDICKKAAEIRIRFAKAKEAEQFARMVQLNADAMENLVDQTKKANDLLLEGLTHQLLEKDYLTVTQEASRQAELSIKTFAELMDRGAKFLPQSNDVEIKDSFPDSEKMDLLTDTIKEIENN